MEKDNFNQIGNGPLAPTIYGENITPLESMNMLVYRINELIGDDTNVKEVVDRLLDEYKSHFHLHGGYCEELRCIAFENPLYAVVSSNVASTTYNNVINAVFSLSFEKGNPAFYQWQYKNDAGVFVDLEASGSNSSSCSIPLTFYNDGDVKEFRCKLQNEAYTFYTSAYVVKYAEPTGTIIQTRDGNVNTYEQNQLTFNTEFETDTNNIGWMWSNDNSTWNEYGRRGVSIKPYYYVDQGTKTNGVSIQSGDKIYWKYQFIVEGKVYFSNTLITNVTKVDYDCGNSLYDNEYSDSYSDKTQMVQGSAHYKDTDYLKTIVDMPLNISKKLNSNIVTSVQWLFRSNTTTWDSEPNIVSILQDATNVDTDIEYEKRINDTSSYYAFRLQVVVGNVSYYSKPCYVYAPVTQIRITISPDTSQKVGSTWTLTGTRTGLLSSGWSSSPISWLVSLSPNSDFTATVNGESIKVIPSAAVTENTIEYNNTTKTVRVGFNSGASGTIYVRARIASTSVIKYFGEIMLNVKS